MTPSVVEDLALSTELAPAPARSKVRRSARRGSDRLPVWLGIIATLVALYFVLPTLFVIPMSFSEANTFVFPPVGFTLDQYRTFFTPTGSPSTN